MSEILLNTLVEKAEQHHKRLDEIEQSIKLLPDYSDDVENMKKEVAILQTNVNGIHFPKDEINELSNQLKISIATLKRPITNEHHHHHYIPKAIFLAAGLFVFVCLLSIGWYHTAQNLEQYKANDTKYRYLKLRGGAGLQAILYLADSVYFANSNLRDSVITGELRTQREIEILEQIENKAQDIKSLKQKISH